MFKDKRLELLNKMATDLFTHPWDVLAPDSSSSSNEVQCKDTGMGEDTASATVLTLVQGS